MKFIIVNISAVEKAILFKPCKIIELKVLVLYWMWECDKIRGSEEQRFKLDWHMNKQEAVFYFQNLTWKFKPNPNNSLVHHSQHFQFLMKRNSCFRIRVCSQMISCFRWVMLVTWRGRGRGCCWGSWCCAIWRRRPGRSISGGCVSQSSLSSSWSEWSGTQW